MLVKGAGTPSSCEDGHTPPTAPAGRAAATAPGRPRRADRPLVVATVVVELLLGWLAVNGLWGLWSGDLGALAYFSSLSALGCLVVAAWGLAGAVRGRARAVPTRLLVPVLVAEVLTAVVAHTLLTPERGPAVTLGLDYHQVVHQALPVTLLVLVALLPRGRVRRADAVLAVVLPVAYLAVVLLGGALAGGVPYPFLDVAARGAGPVLGACLACVAVVAATALAVLVVDRRLGGPR